MSTIRPMSKLKSKGFAAILILLIPFNIYSATLQIVPYAQWTFDTPIEKLIYRQSGNGFPIKLLLTYDMVALYDSTGDRLREIPRSPNDHFVINDAHTGFMLIQVHPSNSIDPQEKLYSFQVFDSAGNAQYTMVQPVDLLTGELMYQFTSELSLLQTQLGHTEVWESWGDDVLLSINSCQKGSSDQNKAHALAIKLRSKHEIITAVSCQALEDTTTIELRLYNHDQVLGESVILPGRLGGLHPISGTDYYFLEIDWEAESSLALFHRMQLIHKYPWKSWKIQQVDPQTILVISESEFNIVNLGDGSLTSSYHPIDIRNISDATYLPEFGIFLYIRYEAFFRGDGRQAFRNFQLEGVNKSGRIVHRSSFGTWTYSLPKITPIGKDLFGIQIHNAVLMYRIGIDQ